MRVPNDKKRPNPNTPTLKRLFRARGRVVDMPRNTDFNSGRNGLKRAARVGPRKSWKVV